MKWNELTPEMQQAANVIGYTQETWDIEDGSDVDIINGDGDLSNNTQDGGASTGGETDAGYYEDYDWDELPNNVLAAAFILGYDQYLWFMGQQWHRMVGGIVLGQASSRGSRGCCRIRIQ